MAFTDKITIFISDDGLSGGLNNADSVLAEVGLLMKVFMKYLVLVALMVSIGFIKEEKPAVYAHFENESVYSSQQVRRDLDYLLKTLASVHPALVNGWSSKQQQAIASLTAEIHDDMPFSEVYYMVNALLVQLHDAHTATYLPLIPHEQMADLPLYWGDEGLIVREDTPLLKKGDIIVQIGNRTESELLAVLRNLIPAENDNWVKANAVRLLPREPFLRVMGLIKQDNLSVTFARAGSERQVEIPLQTSLDRLKAIVNTPYPYALENMQYIIDPSHSLGVYRMDSCSMSPAFLSSIQSFFQEVEKFDLQHIAIDVRNNTGGNSQVIDEILSYTSVKRYKAFGGTRRFSPEATAQLKYDKSTGVQTFPNNAQPVYTKPNTKLFTGQLYVIASNLTFSSANWLAVIVQDNRLGTVIGEPTGNKPTSYGYPLSFKLPESGLAFSVSHCEWVRPDTSRSIEVSLEPDILAPTTAEDIMKNIDPQVEALKKTIH